MKKDANGPSAGWLLTALLVLSLGMVPALADPAEDIEENPRVMVSAPVTPFVFDGDVRDLPTPRPWQPGDPVREIPRRSYPDPDKEYPPLSQEEGVDRLLELAETGSAVASQLSFGTPDRNYDGQGFSGVNPPDTVGEVGPNHFIQMINAGGGATVVIYDKALPTPNVLHTFALESLGSGSCAGGLGDPVALYDRDADRWVLTEFSSSGNNICIYISQTGDPVSGGWFFYGFTSPSFPDYPKYGVWATDANGGQGSYIYTTNETSSGVYAVERGKMLVGAPTSFQRFTIPDLPGFPFNAVTPADADGMTNPPVGAPAVIMRQRDTEVHNGPAAPEDVLEMWHFDVDWVNTANTTFTQIADVDVAEFSSELCGLSAFACFQQPGTGTTLDPLREVIMNRLQYRNFEDYEVLVGNFVTDVDGTERGGVRWFELRRTGGIAAPWTLHQEGLVSPDSDSRFMAGSSMDQSGNIAIAYNVTSTTTFPGLRYTGRLADDPPGSTGPESSIVEGTASNSSNRYGDYSAMGVDPEDDCTFWFTGEYNSSSSWSTRIASFRFDACGCDLFPLPLTASGGNNGDNRIDLTWNDSELVTVEEYRVQRATSAGGPYSTIATVPDSSPGAGGGAGYSYSDTTVSGGITYYYIVRASDGGACTSDASNEVSDTATGVCLLEPLFAGIQTVSTPNSGLCTLNLSWSEGTAPCGGPVTYSVYRDSSPGFSPTELTRIATAVPTTTYTDIDNLVSGTPYYYIVQAVDESNAVTETNTVEVSSIPLGVIQPPLFFDDGGDTVPAQMTGDSPWTNEPAGGNFGAGMYATGTYTNNLCASLTMPEITLGVDNVLSFWSRYEIENSYDKGEVQISTDGGANWERLEVDYPGNSTHSSDACNIDTGTCFTGTNTSWERYSGSLSAYNGQTVMIRFQFGTDGSQTRPGWFIDDIEIGNNAAACATASACPENPLVNVTPDGPADVCSLSIPLLSAELSGGTGPFHYQWYQDGAPIPGATESTYQPTGSGSYNVTVRADACPDDVADGLSTTLDVRSTPLFGGIQSVSDAQTQSCSIDLGWNAASSFCPGPLTYIVYRDTAQPVVQTPGNIVASGLSGTSFSDTTSLSEGQDYYYNVQVVDQSTGEFDGNGAELSASPSGPFSGTSEAFSDSFELAGDFSLWTVTTGPGPHNCGEWVRTTSIGDAPVNSSGSYIAANSQCGGLLPLSSSTITSPTVDLSGIVGLQSVTLDLDLRYDTLNGDDSSIEVWDGAAWQTVWTAPVGAVNEHQSIDVTAYGAGINDFQVRFHYQNANNDRYFSVDNVVVTIEVVNECDMVASVTAVADGRTASTPLRGDRMDPAGDTIHVTWNVDCIVGDYNLLYGDLADVATVTIGGSECLIGTGGSYDWTAVPSGDLFFLVVGTDAVNKESGWGLDSNLVERNGLTPSGECSVTVKDASSYCP